MARSSSEVLIELNDEKLTVHAILKSPALFVIHYKGQLMRYRTEDVMFGFKYKNLAFSYIGYANLQADKLNKRFNTNDFTVVQLV